MDIGIIGLGLMGKAMAQGLLRQGHCVWGYDLRHEAREAAEAVGVHIAAHATDVARQSRLILLSLMTSQDRRNLLWGQQALAEALKEGDLLLDTTTARPEDIEEDSVRLGQHGVRLVDVCVSGSSQVVQDRRALALVGDTREGAVPYESILSAFTKNQYYFGQPGQGNRAKLIVNTVFGLHRLVLAEALALARKGGFDLDQILDVLKQGETYSVAMDTKAPKMIAGVYGPAVARLEQHAKDVGLILAYAESMDAEMPVSRLHLEILQRALEKGCGPLDNAAIFQAYS